MCVSNRDLGSFVYLHGISGNRYLYSLSFWPNSSLVKLKPPSFDCDQWPEHDVGPISCLGDVFDFIRAN